MIENFATSLTKVLRHEGGYSNHKDDPGGETNKGVTKKVYDAWRQVRNLPIRSVKQITADEVATIYRTNYWDAVKADKLPDGVDYCVFDGAVNSGPSRATRWLQAALRVGVDGRVGPETIEAASTVGPSILISLICDTRLAFLRGLKTWATFGKGWDRRVSEVRRDAMLMVGVPQSVPRPRPRPAPDDPGPEATRIEHTRFTPQEVKQKATTGALLFIGAVAAVVAYFIFA